MATYVGYAAAGVPGSVVATLGLITPSIIVILIIAGFLQKFRQSKVVDAVFYGLRPASTALIASACLTVALAVLVKVGGVMEHTFQIHWPALILTVAVFLGMRYTRLKNLHPIVLIAASAAIGAALQF
jgi:chromate transporter